MVPLKMKVNKLMQENLYSTILCINIVVYHTPKNNVTTPQQRLM